MTKDEVLKLALEALECALSDHRPYIVQCKEAITAIKKALAQLEQEPVSYTGNGTAGREADVRPTGFFFQMPKSVGEVYGWHGAGKGQPMCRFNASEAEMPVGTKLYTAPPQRKPLTDEEIGAILEGVNAYGTRLYTFARAIEAKLKDKNEAL